MSLTATLHRGWYAAGDVVRVQICLQSPFNPPEEKNSGILTSMRFRRFDNYFTVIDPDAPLVSRVKTLSAQILGACVVDPRRIQYALNEKENLNFVNESLPKEYDVYKLFSSSEFTLVKDLPLRERESRALVLTFTLPEYLPPSFRGQCVRFYYGIHLRAEFFGPREISNLIKLRIPIKIFSSQAVLTPMLLPPCFPIENFNFKENIILLQSVPSPAITDPLKNQLLPSEVETFDSSKIWRKASSNLSKRLSEQKNPLEFPLKIFNELTLTVGLVSTIITIGDTLNGVFFIHKNIKSQVIKILGTLEFLECCRIEHLKKGISCHQLPGGDKGLVVAQTTVIEEYDWAVMDRNSVHFLISFTNLNNYASMQTDLVTTCWQLRLRFIWTKPLVSQQLLIEGRCEEILIEEDQPELIIPLTVVPPHQPEHPRMGSTLQATS